MPFLPTVVQAPFSAGIPPPLHSLTIGTTPNGFNIPARGWNSWGLQANPNVNPRFLFNQRGVLEQCDHLASTLAGIYTYCSLDSGWSQPSHGDIHGRIIPDSERFDIKEIADHLHAEGLHLGVYVVPGGFREDMNKTILGTHIQIGEVCTGDNGLARCNWNHTMNGVQQWHNSVVNQFAEWGVDFIKLDFITPGSPNHGAKLPLNETLDVVAYHKAIKNASRPMRLDISWKLARDETHFGIWSKNADSFRTDQDINESGSNTTLAAWATVQRAIDNYRQYIVMHTRKDEKLTLYPDMDNLYIGNSFGEDHDGLNKAQRYTIMNHWMGAASNLMLGNDLTKLDATGIQILTNTFALSVAQFASTYPMRPRNPGTGYGHAKQLQAWIGGPDVAGKAMVLLANYGPDQGQGGFNSSLVGTQTVSISWSELGLSRGAPYRIRDVWKGQNVGIERYGLSAALGAGESWLVMLTPVRPWGW